jgi:integrase
MARRGNGEGTITQRKDGRWEAKIDVTEAGKRRRKSIYGRTRQEVARRLTQALRDRDQGLPIRMDERTTVAAYLEAWLRDTVRPSVRPMTYVSYDGHVRKHLIPVIGSIPLVKLTPQDVRAVQAAALKPRTVAQKGDLPPRTVTLSPKTVAHVQATLRTALQQALKDGLVARNVATLVNAPRQVRHDQQVLDPDQARTFLAAAQGDRLGALYVVTMAVGLRQGEALGLKWSDVDLDAGTITVSRTLQRVPKPLRGDDDEGHGTHYRLVEPKTATSRRTVPLPKFVVPTLKAHRARQAEERLAAGPAWDPTWDLVFATTIGTPLDSRNVTHAFQALLARAGLPFMRFHDLRHSAATLMLAQGVAPRVIMETLGHSQIGITMNLYAHVLPAAKRDAADRMDDLFTVSA